jgi:hypothetical protein
MMWFKKSHSICYALNVVLQLHLIEAGVYSWLVEHYSI